MATADKPQKLDREILRLAAVVVVGTIMAILDATIVNVAVPTLRRELNASISTIQWVMTGYLLAFASVIPLTGWASERFGAKQVWITALLLFLAGSVLAGAAWSVDALIAFRVLQGFGGGLLMPVGQTILARAAGPQRIGRVITKELLPQRISDRSQRHRRTGVTRLRFFHRIDSQCADRVDALFVDVLPARRPAGVLS